MIKEYFVKTSCISDVGSTLIYMDRFGRGKALLMKVITAAVRAEGKIV